MQRHWTTAEGLPVAELTGVAQGADGYLWIGTYDGLVRFDGIRFVTLRPAQEPALDSPRIVAVVPEGDDIWISTAAGLTRLRAGRFERVAPESAADGPFQVLHRRAGRLWALARHALYEIDANGALRRVEGVPRDRDLLDLFVDRSGRIWLLTSRGIGWREGGALHWRLTSAPVIGAARTDRGILFFRQGLPPLLRHDGGWETAPQGLAPRVRLLGSSVRAETPWGTSFLLNGDRLLRSDGRSLEAADAESRSFTLRPGFALEDRKSGRWTALGPTVRLDNRVVLRVANGADASALALDREGTIWVATSRAGLYALSPAAVHMLEGPEGVDPLNVYGVFADRSGTLWVGAQGAGVWRHAASGWTRISTSTGDGGPAFGRSFFEDDRGTLWVGLLGGVYRLAGDRLARVAEPGAPRVRVNSFAEDDRGRIWAGTADGLVRRDLSAEGAIWRSLPSDGRALGDVRDLLWTPGGGLWVAGTEGLARFDGVRWQRFGRREGLPTDLMRSLTLDADGVLWVGTDDAGLLRVDPRTNREKPSVFAFGPEQGIPTTVVHAVLEGDDGSLWLSSNRGLFRVEKQDLDEVAAGRRARVRAIRFDEVDGMRDAEANGGTGDAGMRTGDGRLWFATQNGVAVVEPAALLPAGKAVSKARIEAIRVGQTLHAPADPLTLAADQRTFSVLFTAPAPSTARWARFRYRLAGFDDRWSEAGKRREAFFTGIPAGTYRFEVETLGVPGLLASSRASTSIVVLPLVWETGWFRALLVVAGLALLGAIALWRERAQRRRRRQLEAIVRERTAVVRDQAERLRRLDRVKSDLFTDVSHEFRTPLTLAIGPLQDLLDGARGTLDASAREEVELALRNARRLLDLINQILDLARMEAGQVRLARERRALAPFLRERVEAFAALARHDGVELRLEIAPELSGSGASAAFDHDRLGRAVDNLILNALQWTPAGGQIEVRLARRGEEAEADGSPEARFEISVRDTGPGIAPAHLERIFLRFQRAGDEAERLAPESGPAAAGAGSKEVRRGGGTGIGLAQTREIARLHGGSLEVESVEGQGTTFRILLPVLSASPSSEAPSAGPAEAAPVHPAGEPTIAPGGASADPEETPADDERPLVLVVDDERDMRDYVRRTLEADYRVVVAGDGEEALVRARALVPDVVVCDIMMPKVDGIAVAAAFRRDPELDFVPFVLLTARGADEVRVEALEAGVDDYLTKPFLRRELLSRIQNLLARRRQWSAPAASVATRAPGPGSLLHLPPAADAEPADATFLHRLVRIADESLDDPDLGVEELARRLACDRTSLFRRLRDLTGETPSALLRRLRLERAEQLLRARAGNVSEVAYATGFRAVSHFSRAFRDHFGATPSAIARAGPAPLARPPAPERLPPE